MTRTKLAAARLAVLALAVTLVLGIGSTCRAVIVLPPSHQMYALYAGAPSTQSYLYRINVATGVAEQIGNTTLAGLQSLTTGLDGKLYSWNNDLGLLTIDASTAQATDVNPLINSSLPSTLQSLALAPNGKLVGVIDVSDNNRLYEIDPATGAATLIGQSPSPTPLGLESVRGIEFLGNRLFGVAWHFNNPTSPLFEIDPQTAAITQVGLTGTTYLNSLTKDRDGTLYSIQSIDASTANASQLLVVIDPATGMTIDSTPITPDVFQRGYSPRAIAFLIPEPSIGVLLAAVTLMRRRGRK
jgi:hypothetical protein